MAESNTIIFKDFQACRSGLKIFDSTVYFINTYVNSSFFFIHENILYSNKTLVSGAQNIIFDTNCLNQYV